MRVIVRSNSEGKFHHNQSGSNVVHFSRRKFYFVEPFRVIADEVAGTIITEDGDTIITESGDSLVTE